jgi:hypothetical protein
MPPKGKNRPDKTTPSQLSNTAQHQVYTPYQWLELCYHVFASQICSRLPRLPLDDVLCKYLDVQVDVEPNPRQFLQKYFGSRMMGRCYFLTEENRMGMGTGFMLPGDLIIAPLGCRTPIVIREQGNKTGRYRLVGDVYLDGYMDGKAMTQVKAGEKNIEKFVLV